MEVPHRKSLPHEIPSWVDPQKEIYFISINCETRSQNQLASLNIWKDFWNGPASTGKVSMVAPRVSSYARSLTCTDFIPAIRKAFAIGRK